MKFTLPEGVVTVRGEMRREGAFVLLIADTGIGIEPDALPALFEPFQQADASISRRFGGPGLGLAISHRLMLLHGGSLEIANHAGGGTVVQAVFPAARVVVGMAPVQRG